MSNQIQLRERASYSYCARLWRQLTNSSRKKLSKKELKTTSKKELKKLELSRLRFEQLLRVFRALQTSRVLHTSMNARWRMRILLAGKLYVPF